jgi:malate synthase
VAHPDLVPVAMAEFDAVLGDRPNQLGRQRDEVEVGARELLDLDFPGAITTAGLETNVSVGIRYLASWLSGTGAAAIDNLMEDVATAEISRSQIWQWLRHGMSTDEGEPITEDRVRALAGALVESLEEAEHPHRDRLAAARKVFEDVALGDHFVEFLTLSAYELIN